MQEAKTPTESSTTPQDDPLLLNVSDSLYLSEMSIVPLSAFVLTGKVPSFQEVTTPNNWQKIDSLQKEIDSELQNTDSVLSVLKERLASLPQVGDNDSADGEEMSRPEMANYIEGIL